MFDILKKTIKHTAIYGVGTLSSKLIGFVLLPIYTSYLTTSDYGVLAIVEITSQLVTAVIGLKINTAFFRWYWDARYKEKQKSIYFSSLAVLFIVSILVVFIFYQFSEEFSLLLFGKPDFTYLLNLMIISSAMQILIGLVQSLMRLQEKSIYFSSTTIIKLLVTLVLTIIFITQAGRGINGIYEALVIGELLFLLITIGYSWKNIELSFEPTIVKDMLVFSLPLILAEISGILLSVSDRYCLNFLLNESEVGIYSLGFKISNTIRVFLYSSAMMAVSPLIFKYIDKPNNKRFYSKLLTYFTFIVMIFVLLLSLFGKEFVQLVARDESYWGASTFIPVITFSILFGIMKDISLTGLNITKKTKVIAFVVILMAALNIGLNLLLIPIIGAMGAAYATLVTRILSFVIFYNLVQKIYFIPYELKKTIQIVLIGFVILLISYFLAPLGAVLEIGLKIFLFFSFPIVLYHLNFYEPVELLRLKQIWNTWKNPLLWKANFLRINKSENETE